MAKKRTAPPPGWNGNRVVAYNLHATRTLRGWTQEQAAAALAKHLGTHWSKASWSAAERSADGLRPREFTADEIVAFSLTFEVPVGWWFLPPGDERPDMSDATRATYALMQLGLGIEPYMERISTLLEGIGPYGDLTQMVFRHVVTRAVDAAGLAKVQNFKDALGELLAAIERVEEGAN